MPDKSNRSDIGRHHVSRIALFATSLFNKAQGVPRRSRLGFPEPPECKPIVAQICHSMKTEATARFQKIEPIWARRAPVRPAGTQN